MGSAAGVRKMKERIFGFNTLLFVEDDDDAYICPMTQNEIYLPWSYSWKYECTSIWVLSKLGVWVGGVTV